MQIFNTLTRQKEEFVPQVPGEYRIYVCGPTVYNYIHIGNARPLIVFDTLRRYLEYRGNKVTFFRDWPSPKSCARAAGAFTGWAHRPAWRRASCRRTVLRWRRLIFLVCAARA